VATAAEAAQARDEAESQARVLYTAAVTYVATQAVMDGEEDDDDSLVLRAAVLLALALLRTVARRTGTDVTVESLPIDRDDLADDLGRELADVAIRDSRKHLDTIERRETKKNPDVPRADVVQKFRNDDNWINAAARTTTTKAASDTLTTLLPLIEDETGLRHELLWVSRGDHRVRSSHRRLHGKTRPFGKTFKSWPSGQVLRFPGDPLAPLDEVINCRCTLLVVPATMARSGADRFGVTDPMWDAIDNAPKMESLAASVGWVRPDDSQAVSDLTAERSTDL
jgi:hypothetical protein